MDIPMPTTKGIAYINHVSNHGGQWFARIALYVGDNQYKEMNLLMLKAAERMAVSCLEIEGKNIHESEWGKNQWFKVVIEHHPKYDGRLKSLNRVQPQDIEKWKT